MSVGAAVLIFREGLEAALILAIMLGYLRKIGRLEARPAVWAGALSAAGLAIVFTLALQMLGAQFDYPAKGIYEGVTSLLAVAMLTFMIYWMARQARYIKGSLEHSMRESLYRGASWGLFGVAFLTVAREGVETALFLSASAFQTSGAATLIGGLTGLALALVAAWAVYVAGVRLNIKTFFRVTSVLLLVFGAAIFRYAIHEFEEVGWLPPIIEHVWNTGPWLPVGSTAGAILQALIGYTSTPSLLQVIGYFGYLAVTGLLVFGPFGRATTSQLEPSQPAPVERSGQVTERSADRSETVRV
jgi:high-affinity iron transporter